MHDQSLGKWLESKRWDYWETLTFEWDVSPSTARRAVSTYHEEWSPHGAAWVIEHGRVGGRTHLHQLSYYVAPPDPSDLWHWWHARYGRAQIVPHDPQRGGVGYLLKAMHGAREDHMRRGVDWDIVSRSHRPLTEAENLPF